MAEFINTIDVLGDDVVIDSIIEKTITEFKDDVITKVGQYAFRLCTALTEVDLPNITSIEAYAFQDCTALHRMIAPFADMSGTGQCQGCTALEIADILSIGSNVWDSFYKCASLKVLIIRGSSVSQMTSTNLIGSTPIASGTGYIYVPRDLVESYKTATNWSTYANQFRPLEDYTVDGTVTGALDETKI